MGRIIIAGKPREMPKDIEVTTYLDPQGKSFYAVTYPVLKPRVVTDSEGIAWELVRPRRSPSFNAAGLGGAGWEAADPDKSDPIRGLRQVIHAIVLHHDAAPSSDACFRVLVEKHYSTHFMIDRDGHIWQAADVADETIHATVMNRVSVGIDLNNPADNLLVTPGAMAPGRTPSQVMEINGNQYQSWNYTEEQYRSLIALLRVLIEDLQIQPVFPVDETGTIVTSVLDSDPKEFHGIVCHWHVQAEKWDPGPGLDWERIVRELREEGAAIPVIPDGIEDNLEAPDRAAWGRETWANSDTAQRAVVQAFKDEETAARLCLAVCRAAERGSEGGWYPMGINQTWHGGIHIPAKRGTLVRPLIKGELVAAHLVPESEFPEAGSNNFVLLRHRIPLPPRASVSSEETTNILTVFSLYMHLDGVDLDHPPQTRLFERLLAHEATPDPEPEPATGPMLTCAPDFNQVKALRRGYVGIFSDKPASVIELDPRDAIGFAGEFQELRGERRVVHVEVFADSSCLEAMELGLYGRYLEAGPEEPESKDLVVRSWYLIDIFRDAITKPGSIISSPKILSPDALLDWFREERPEEQEILRKMIVRHVSEWSDRVDWVSALVTSQQGKKWIRYLASDETRWVFREEIRQFLQFSWLTEEVARRIGLAWEDGLVYTFHPIRFLQWWLYRRSAVRGKTLDALLKELGGVKNLSTTAGVPDVLSDL